MTIDGEEKFQSWFKQATGYDPYLFQIRFGCDPTLFQHPSPLAGEGRGEGGLVDVPMGLGKTAMAG